MSPARGGDGEPVRLALVLGGGASLGAYVGGVVAEVLEALVAQERGGVELGVIAGSSAGAVTAALAARAMTVNPEVIPFLRKLWVDALDFEVFLDPDRPNPAGLLSDAALRELSEALIAADPASDDLRPAGVADTLRVGLTLSNLSGVPHPVRYRFANAPDRLEALLVHRDAIAFELTPPVGAGEPLWERMRRAALASAAFPFAFPPVELERDADDYPAARFPNASASHRMWFADGGLFANEPIGLARNLVRRGTDDRSAEWRYVLVDPDLGETRALDRPRSPSDVAGALTRAVLGQAAASDWVEASDTNRRLEVFEAIVERLPEIADGLCDPDALKLGHVVTRLAERVAEEACESDDEDAVLEHLDRELARIESDPRFRAVLDQVGTRASRTRLAKLIYALEAAGDLRDKRVLPLYLVAPRADEPLAGSFMGGFGGFLEAEWRAHDFESGRRDAARLLAGHFGDVLDYRGDPDAFEPRLRSTPSYATASVSARARVDRFVDRETGRILDSVRPGPLFRLFGWAWKPAVRKWVQRWVRQSLER